MDGIDITAQFTPAQSLIGSAAVFHEVAPAEHADPEPPAFMLGTVPNEIIEAHWGRGFKWVHAQGVLEINAEMHWPYFLTRDGAPLDYAWANLHGGHLVRVWRDRPEATPRHIEPHVLICGQGHEIFGHWLADFLPKLWALYAAGLDLAKLRYVVPDGTPRWGLEMLRLCGIGGEQVTRVRHYEVLRGTFLIPTTVHNGIRGPHFAEAARFLTERMGVVPMRRGVRLFLSRPGMTGLRAASNRLAIERAAYGQGYSVISPERLSLMEQFRLVAGAEAIAGEYGSQLHLSMFADAGVPVCAIRGTGLHPGFIQSAIGSALRQPTGYIFCARQDGDPPEGFTAPLDLVREALHQCATQAVPLQNAGTTTAPPPVNDAL